MSCLFAYNPLLPCMRKRGVIMVGDGITYDDKTCVGLIFVVNSQLIAQGFVYHCTKGFETNLN
jgi:hypothetical protein